MRGKFKHIVGKLIKSLGVVCDRKEEENWMNIVIRLSWQTVALLKPGAKEDQFRIKCIATGSRIESQVFQGCAFMNDTVHKLMKTRINQPRLMLINGSLDLASTELSSFESRIQMLCPNIVLVEKSVPRHIQEYFLEKQIMILFNVKLHCLERIARSSHSTIMSWNLHTVHHLGTCDLFQIDEYEEEHNVLDKGGKTTKTLISLLDLHTGSGCTILLMGADQYELKMIKCVVRRAIVIADHLMLETSFLLDQRAMFSTIPLNKEKYAENEVNKSSSTKIMDYKDAMQILRSSEQNLLCNEDETCSVLNSENILVLMSKRNASSGTICEQSHFSHIKFYKNFNDPLEIFLHKNLLNEGLQCETCGKPPNGHFYYYTHHNKQLTLQVRRLADGTGLSGESEGKLWMWSRCGVCNYESGSSKSTKRVLISANARGLSFAKFLELNFSNHPSFHSSSICGHSLHTNFLYFFGFGQMVAMLRYSPVMIYSLSLPREMLDFKSSLREDLLKKDVNTLQLGLRFPINDDYIVECYDNEFSNLIACALTILHNPHTQGVVDKIRGVVVKSNSVICLYDEEFRQLRGLCCLSELDYIASLSRCKNWDAKGGKSKSFFSKTLDDRFIIKEIKRTEYDSFVKFAPKYFNYMDDCYMKHNQTCLAKVLGVYQVIVRASEHQKETRHDLLVMENLSFGRKISKQYDLKGALHARYNNSGDLGAVLLDQNFIKDMDDSPIYMSLRSMHELCRAVWNDTTFLRMIDVMDYSLLVGLDSEGPELVCGIIDYLRQYTWDKQLESSVKYLLLFPKKQRPTIISPEEYVKRFRKFIGTHFLFVPNHWCTPQVDFQEGTQKKAKKANEGNLKVKKADEGQKKVIIAEGLSAVLLRPPLVDDATYQGLGKQCQQLCDLLRSLPTDVAFYPVSLESDPFYSEDVEMNVFIVDIIDLLIMDRLTQTILKIFAMYLHKLCMDDSIESIGFMCPDRISETMCAKSENIAYMTTAMQKQQSTKFILAPYFQKKHWVLLIICPQLNMVYFLDPMGNPNSSHFVVKKNLNKAFESYSRKRGVRGEAVMHWKPLMVYKCKI